MYLWRYKTVQSVKEIFNEIKGITSRPEQVRLAEAIFKAFERKRYALYESPTGTGKTLAMLVASALVAQKYKNNAISYAISFGRVQQTLGSSKVVIATPTKDLQMQIMDEFSKWIKPIFPDLKIAIIKGKSNYIDKYELHAAINRAEDEEEKEKLIQFSEAVETCGGDIDMLTDISDKLGIDIEDFQYSPSYYHLEKDTFRNQNGNQFRPDYYFLCACDKAKAADIVVTNHAFFIAYNWYQNKKANHIEIAKIKGSTNEMDEAEMRLLFEVDGIPFAFDNVIIDEAHTYPSRVVRMLASEIAFSYIARICNEIATYLKKYKNRDKKITYDMINDVEKQAKKIDSIAKAIEDAASSSDVRGYMQVSQLIQSNTKLGNEMIEQIPKVFKALSKIHDNVMKTSIIPVAK
ncbi:MAG: DEAD/DEAH box helicase, partial [Caldanaerobacter sp.]